jgi:hypothetical protein
MIMARMALMTRTNGQMNSHILVQMYDLWKVIEAVSIGKLTMRKDGHWKEQAC